MIIDGWTRLQSYLKSHEIYFYPVAIAFVIALMCEGAFHARFLLVFAPLSVVLVLLLWVFDRWEDAAMKRDIEKQRGSIIAAEELYDEVQNLSIEQAKLRFEEIAAADARIKCLPATAPLESAHSFAPALRDLLSRYECVSLVVNTDIGRDYISEWDFAPGYIVIGNSDEHVDAIVRPNEETVYDLVLDDPELSPDEMIQDSYPSVYHMLLYYASL